MGTVKTVLIVEDNEHMRQSLFERLKEDGDRVMTAANFEEGLAALRANTVDLIVLDLLLGGEADKAGPDLVKTAQADPATHFDSVAIVVLSDWDDPIAVLGDVLPPDRYEYFHKLHTSLDQIAEHIKQKLHGNSASR
jgi:DNA-binding NarL/FixJ family response regulator